MPRKNVLLIFTDQQRFDTMAAYGNSQIRTPHLNRLAEQSTVFERAYVTQPVCTPSRGSILTGLYPHTHGASMNNIPLPESVACLPELTARKDYATGYFGKWHLGDEIAPQHGFDEWVSIEDHYRKYYQSEELFDRSCSYHHFLREAGFQPDHPNAEQPEFSRFFATRVPAEYSKPAFLAQRASEFIRKRRDQPFILCVNFLEPHTPYHSAYDNEYAPEDMELSSTFAHRFDTDLQQVYGERQYPQQGDFDVPMREEAPFRLIKSRYWGSVSLVDHCTGQILNTLADCGLDENTIVVFTSDHGDMMSDFGMVAKSVPFDGATRVPFLLRVPGGGTADRVAQPISQVDLVPTLLELLGEPQAPSLQGESLVPLLSGQARPERDVIIEWNPREAPAGEPPAVFGRTLVTPELWKMTLRTNGIHELYHLGDDPDETNNVYHQAEYQDIAADLRQRLQTWQQQTGDHIEWP